jgi:hypothetical protein
MTNHQWGKDKCGEHVFGKITHNRLRNTKGVMIFSWGWVIIAHFDEGSVATAPYINCTADKFQIVTEDGNIRK